MKFSTILSDIASVSSRLGRTLTRQALMLYFVLKDGDLSASDKLVVYGSLLYIIVPNDLIPRRLFKLLGIVDDVTAGVIVARCIYRHVTPDIELKVDMILDRWFGYQIKSTK